MTGWTAPARTPEALQAYAAAEEDRAARPDRYQLGADAIDIVSLIYGLIVTVAVIIEMLILGLGMGSGQ